VLGLAGLDKVLDRAGDVLDGHLRVDAVLVVEVDGVDAEPVQRAVDDLFDDLGPAGDPPLRFAFDGIDVPAELGGDHDLALVRGERLTDEFLVGVTLIPQFMRARADGGRGTKDIRASFGGTPLLLWPWVALQSHNVVRFLQPGLEFVVQVRFRLHEDVVTAPFRSVVCRLDNPRAVQPPMQGETGKKPVLARWQASEPTLATQASRVFCGITWTSLMSAASRRMFVPARVRRARPWQSPSSV
jgi:hypothetical protein